MPLHDMKCFNAECNHQDEEFIFVTEELPKICPKCGKETYRKIYSNIADWNPHPCIFNGKWPEVTKEALHEADRQLAEQDRKNAALRRRYGA